MTNEDKVDRLIAFALAMASEQDDFARRELGPIHLVKHVYLADLAYAATHEGQTFTGTDWKFHHLGPWSVAVFKRLEPVAHTISAIERRFPTTDDKDAFRWSLPEPRGIDAEQERKEFIEGLGDLPREARTAIKFAIRDFGQDTQALLDYVYKTKPMLKAAPGESLDFKVAIWTPRPETVAEGPITAKQRKRRREEVNALVERVRAALADRRANVVPATPADPAPRYDETFFTGVEALDHLAGDAIPEGSGVIAVSDEVWKSKARADLDDDE